MSLSPSAGKELTSFWRKWQQPTTDFLFHCSFSRLLTSLQILKAKFRISAAKFIFIWGRVRAPSCIFFFFCQEQHTTQLFDATILAHYKMGVVFLNYSCKHKNSKWQPQRHTGVKTGNSSAKVQKHLWPTHGGPPGQWLVCQLATPESVS